jgi:hypothetical protein
LITFEIDLAFYAETKNKGLGKAACVRVRDGDGSLFKYG